MCTEPCEGPADCKASPPTCFENTCEQGCCVMKKLPENTPLGPEEQTQGDCSSWICGATGAVEVADFSDEPADQDTCHKGGCDGATAEQAPVTGPCDFNGGTVCGIDNGEPTGACVTCNSAAECPTEACRVFVCASHLCDGTAKPMGTPCTDGGAVCDLNGDCVECLANTHCTDPAKPVCAPDHKCVAAACIDGLKNGGETDVDCGGPTCPQCALQKICAQGADCTSGLCWNQTCRVCTPGSVSACYTGPAGTQSVGQCKPGSWTCAADGLGHGPCTGELTPAAETCTNPVDESCDGVDCLLWGKVQGGAGQDRALAVGMDPSGNVYVGGGFDSTLPVGNLPVLTAQGGDDAFLIKYDPAGTPLFSKRFGLDGDQRFDDIAFDSSGNVVVTGSFTGSINFGPGPLMATGEQGFVVKFDPFGGVLWSTVLPSYGAPRLAVDAGNNIAMAGQALSGGDPDVWVGKLDADGQNPSYLSFGSASPQIGRDVAVDASGNLYVIGEFAGSLGFGSTLQADLVDVFVVKINSSGGLVWARKFGDANAQRGVAIAALPSGDIVIGGEFAGSIDFGGATLTSAGQDDTFIARLNASGDHVWSKSFGNGYIQAFGGLGVDANGDVTFTVSSLGALDFGGGPLTSAGDRDIFVVKLDGAGNHRWSKRYGGSDVDVSFALATRASGVAVAGYTAASIDFGFGPQAGGGQLEAFVVKLGP